MITFIDLTSLRGKITSAYIFLVVSTTALGIIAYSDLLFLERQVTEGEVVSDLKDAILEMRREEKNLFIYEDTDSFTRVDEHAALSLSILQDYQTALDAIIREFDPLTMTKALNNYRTQLGHWNAVSISDREPLQDEIRTLGHRIYLSVESLSNQERRVLETAVRKSQWFLLISVCMIGLAIYVVGRQLRHVAVTPLKQLDEIAYAISDNEAAKQLKEAKQQLFNTITEQHHRAA